MKAYPEPISQAFLGEILAQTKQSIYQVYRKDGKTILGIGLFCYLLLEDKKIPIIVIGDCKFDKEEIDSITIFKNNNMRNGLIELKLGNIRIKNTELNLIAIEIEDNQRIGIHFLELDDRLYEKEHECYFKKDSLYIIQCSDINNILVSSGVISDINNNTFKYLGCNNPKGSIIFNSLNNEIIGINSENKSTFNNIGLFLNQ